MPHICLVKKAAVSFQLPLGVIRLDIFGLNYKKPCDVALAGERPPSKYGVAFTFSLFVDEILIEIVFLCRVVP